MSPTPNAWLLLAAALDAIAALLHVGCIVFGAAWYRFFGAGERMARLAEAGDWRPTVVTSGIAIVLSVWALYALSAAGVRLIGQADRFLGALAIFWENPK